MKLHLNEIPFSMLVNLSVRKNREKTSPFRFLATAKITFKRMASKEILFYFTYDN